MPLFKDLDFKAYRILIWKIEEDIDDLMSTIQLHPSDKAKYGQLKNPVRQREFLALRQCLRLHFGSNPPVHYTDGGKPYLQSGEQISFSHTQEYAGLVISEKLKVGIDLEAYRERVRKIAPKFMRPEERHGLDPNNEIAHLVAYWSAKEVMVKIEGDRRLDFLRHLRVAPFTLKNRQKSQGLLIDKKRWRKYHLEFLCYPEVLLTFGWEEKARGKREFN